MCMSGQNVGNCFAIKPQMMLAFDLNDTMTSCKLNNSKKKGRGQA